jgi:uncharacterized protein
MVLGGNFVLLTLEQIKNKTEKVVSKYPVKKVSVFGSFARGGASDDSDIDFLVEFASPNVSLFLISEIKTELESKLARDVDLIHAPVEENSLLVIDEVVDIYEN